MKNEYKDRHFCKIFDAFRDEKEHLFLKNVERVLQITANTDCILFTFKGFGVLVRLFSRDVLVALDEEPL